jgi:hypothetical protein
MAAKARAWTGVTVLAAEKTGRSSRGARRARSIGMGGMGVLATAGGLVTPGDLAPAGSDASDGGARGGLASLAKASRKQR